MITISINPIAFTVGSIEVRRYGIMIALAIVVFVLRSIRVVRRGAKVSYDTVFAAALVGIPSDTILSRLFRVIDGWVCYGQN
jgi:phosphatidylglycerol:prolipoprotein diacylglycerol transferase